MDYDGNAVCYTGTICFIIKISLINIVKIILKVIKNKIEVKVIGEMNYVSFCVYVPHHIAYR